MFKDNSYVAWGATIIGIVLMVISKTMITDNNQTGSVIIGIGAAFAVLGVGNLASGYFTKAVITPEILKVSSREENDERNIRVREKAGWNASRITVYILCFLALASAFMNIELYITLLFVMLILIESSLIAASLLYYEKRI